MPRIIGYDFVDKRLKGMIGPQMAADVGQALLEGAQLIQSEAQLSITTGSVMGKEHVASLPGEPPNANWRTLDKNIEATQTGPLSAEVSSNAPYAAWLEFGTSKMAERPYMRPAAQRNREAVAANIRGAINKNIGAS